MLTRSDAARLQEIIIDAELFKQRDSLLFEVPANVQAHIDSQRSPGEQIAADLKMLNDVAADGHPEPLQTWLRNAHRLIESPRVAGYVKGLCTRLGGAPTTPALNWTEALKIAREPAFREAANHIAAGDSTALLAPRGIGGAPLILALQEWLTEQYPQWSVALIEARPTRGESVDDYQARMAKRLRRSTRTTDERHVALVHTWSNLPAHRDHQAALGQHLRSRLEARAGFSLLAVGGFILYTLALGNHRHSVLNDAQIVWLDDLRLPDLQRLLTHLAWSADDAATIEAAGGGHDGILRAVIEARADAADWQAASAAAWNQELHYRNAFISLSELDLMSVLAALIEDEKGLRMKLLKPMSLPFRLFFEGIGTRKGASMRARLVPRCANEMAQLKHELD